MDKERARILGKAARGARKALGLTQEQIAEKLDLSVEFYARIERGVARPSLVTFARMVPVLGVSADALLGTDATRAARPKSPPLIAPDDDPELRALASRLRTIPASTLRMVRLLLCELERADSSGKRSRGRRAGTSSPLSPGEQ